VCVREGLLPLHGIGMQPLSRQRAGSSASTFTGATVGPSHRHLGRLSTKGG
jgi:hypothetical protein